MRRAALLAVALVATACTGGDATEEPAARYLVFTKAIDQPQQAVWIGDVNGSKMRRLTRGAYGLVSPDGTKIAVSRRPGSSRSMPAAAASTSLPKEGPAHGSPTRGISLPSRARRSSASTSGMEARTSSSGGRAARSAPRRTARASRTTSSAIRRGTASAGSRSTPLE